MKGLKNPNEFYLININRNNKIIVHCELQCTTTQLVAAAPAL
jgi:hypothetical protein